ncbi:uncharacterized protein LOC124313899 [Daphnia pulicaria]|uniref:uncharacterized protein LOC124313899 n=1 Tax=Daphnia pulicaria TaxID=35523 RepID=UPI001EECA0BE|nr:uncharacterized protein LOC124313899 [Daphnia pulicaria]
MGPTKKPASNRQQHQSICLLLIGSVMVVSTVALHCTSFVRGVMRLKANGLGPDGANLTTANLINVGIEHLNYTCVLIGVHAGFFIVSLTSNWSAVWDALILIQENLNFKSSFYHKCRKVVLVGFSLLFTDCIIHIFVSIQSSYWDMGVMRPLAIVLANISRTTAMSVYFLFCVLTRIVTLVFQGLNEQIAYLDEAKKFAPFYSTRILNIRLEKWRRNHALACRLVELINSSLGLVMLMTIVNVFVTFITTSFEIVRSMRDFEPVPFLFVYIFIKKFILLIVLIYEPYRLQAEAGRTAASIRSLQPLTSDLFTQIKLNTVVMEVTHAGPKITAMEFFDINLRLLPTLLGSALTYVAILCQASST